MDMDSLSHKWCMCSSPNRTRVDRDVVQHGEFASEFGAESSVARFLGAAREMWASERLQKSAGMSDLY
jgi:hypothetical protein